MNGRSSKRAEASVAGTAPGQLAATARDLDDVDRRMIAALVEDGRLSAPELARRIGVSRATAYARFERLVGDGVVTAFRAEVRPEALGYQIAALILVNVEQSSWEGVRDALVHLPGFEYLAVTSGGFDFAVLVRVADVASLRDVVLQRLHKIAAVRSTQTIFVMDEERRPVGAKPIGEAPFSAP